MKRITFALLLLSLCPLLTPVAWASWGAFTSTGTATGVGNPSCAEASTNLVACAVRNGKSSLVVSYFNGTKWGAWKSLAGTVSSDPSCTSNGADAVICAATATNGDLLFTIFNGTTRNWSTPTKVTGALYSGPSCAEYTAGQALCAARNASGGVAWSLYNGTSWSAFANLTASTVSRPSCTTDGNGGVICGVFTTGYNMLVNRFLGGSWDGFLNVGGTSGGIPDCLYWSNTPGQVTCWVEGANGQLYYEYYNPGGWGLGNWGGYTGIGGGMNDDSGFTCASQAANQIVCVEIDIYTSNQLWANVWTPSTYWQGWVELGGAGVGWPACAPLGTGQVVCMVMGPNNELTSIVGP